MMSRLKADALLLTSAMIWGGSFVAIKDGVAHIGPCTFVAARFILSALLVLPLAVREHRRAPAGQDVFRRAAVMDLALLCIAFSGATLLQQLGATGTSVGNTGFLTSLYVVLVPVICWTIYKQKLPVWVFPAAIMSVFGVWLLSGGSLQSSARIGKGEILVLLCALGFALHVVLVGRVMTRTPAPFRLCFLQYAVMGLFAGAGALLLEHPDAAGLMAEAVPILYAGVLSGGVAYTLQAVAQQYTPSGDAAIILGAEGLFAALAGALLKHERMDAAGIAGCGFIILAILMVELGPRLAKKNI